MTSKSKRNALSAVFVQTVQKTGTYSDGGGLNLRVEESGAKYWFQRVTIDGKRRNLGLGGYPTVSLAEARKAALVNARMIREGRDPLAEKREATVARRRPATPTFAEAGEIVIEMRRPSWSNAKHAAQWASTLSTYAYPKIGPKRSPKSPPRTSWMSCPRFGRQSLRRPAGYVSAWKPFWIGPSLRVTEPTIPPLVLSPRYCQRRREPSDTIQRCTTGRFLER